MGEWGWVVAGYGITGLTLLGYVAGLMIRARRARRRGAQMAARHP